MGIRSGFDPKRSSPELKYSVTLQWGFWMAKAIKSLMLSALLVCLGAVAQDADLRLITGQTRVIAHRGGTGPENTIATGLQSVAQGIRFLEHDVQLTRDGHPVLLHDPTVDRTTNGRGNVADLTLAEVKALDAGSKFIDPTDPSQSYEGEQIPTVSEALKAIGDQSVLLLEPKDVRTAVAVVNAIRLESAFSRAVVRSRDEAILMEVKRIEPRVMTGTLVLGIPPSDELESFLSRLDRLDVSALSVYPLESVTPANVSMLQDAGIAVWGPTADDETAWERLYAAGVDGIMTNKPGELLAWLAGKEGSTAR